VQPPFPEAMTAAVAGIGPLVRTASPWLRSGDYCLLCCVVFPAPLPRHAHSCASCSMSHSSPEVPFLFHPFSSVPSPISSLFLIPPFFLRSSPLLPDPPPPTSFRSLLIPPPPPPHPFAPHSSFPPVPYLPHTCLRRAVGVPDQVPVARLAESRCAPICRCHNRGAELRARPRHRWQQHDDFARLWPLVGWRVGGAFPHSHRLPSRGRLGRGGSLAR